MMRDNIFNSPDQVNYNLNQGIFRNKFYYGKVVNSGDKATDAIVFSDGKYVVDRSRQKRDKNPDDENKNEIKECGLEYKYGLFNVGTFWSNQSIDKFVNGEAPQVNARELYSKIREQFEYFIDVKDPRIFSVSAVYDIGTYCFEIFSAYAYLFYNSEKESGKTKKMKLHELMCFGAVNATSPTESALFRVCALRKPTLVIDDYEQIEEDRQKMIGQILKVGYKRGGQTIRSEKILDRFEPTIYPVYSPKIIGNTTDLDSITLTRCIVIRLLKTATSKGSREPNENNPIWQNIRDDCYLFIMQNWEEIQEIYQKYESTKFNNRNLELVKGILSIASLISKDVHDEIEGFLEDSFEDRDIEITCNDWHYLLFQRIAENVKSDDWYAVSVVSEWCAADITISNTKSRARWIGKTLSKIPLFKKRRIAAGMGYHLTKKAIVEYMRIHGYPIPEPNPNAPKFTTYRDEPIIENELAPYGQCDVCKQPSFLKYKRKETEISYCEECVQNQPKSLGDFV